MNKTQMYGLLGAMGVLGTSIAQAQVSIPADFAYPLNSAVSTSRGFTVRINQASTTAGTLPNSIARAEAQLAGTLTNPLTGVLLTNLVDFSLATFNPDKSYTETATISYDKDQSSGVQFPGIPGLESTADAAATDNIALDAVAWLELQPGTYSMIVNSDDGFRVYAGKDARDVASSIMLGQYDGGRGVGDTIFDFSVSAAGLYSFRLVYEQGGGGAAVSWFTAPVGAPDSRTLVNDAGGVKAYSKINAALPAYISVLEPTPGSSNVTPGIVIKATINDGSATQVQASSVKLSLDGAAVTPTVSKTGSTTSVSFDPPGLLEPSSKHTVKLVYADNGSPVTSKTNEFTFVTSSTGNITLPAPLFIETFDSTAEGALPAGWSVKNFTTGETGAFDFLDPNSDYYLNWVVISRDTVTKAKWDAPRRLNTPDQYVNGEQVKSLINGNFIYAESDNRGGSQVQYLFSPDFNLSGKSDIYLSYHSIYEQNQDSVGAVEYSIDKGATWLPVVYMLDAVDIVKDASGNVDADATLSAENGDTAHYDDPVTGETLGGHYGDFIGVAKSEWKNLGPYISARVNDDAMESKRVEIFRLTKADNQATVRLRFAQAGTGSWYFGVDDVGLYSISTVPKPVISASPAGTTVVSGNKLSLSVVATGSGLTYQWQLNGANIAGATASTYVVAAAKASDAGKYKAVVSNGGGSVTSSEAVVAVVDALSDLSVISNGLVAYLPFDGTYADLAGKGVQASAVGTPVFEAGVRGQGIHINTTKDGSVNNYVTLGYADVLKFGDEKTGKNFSVSFWVKQNSQADDPALISNKDWGSSNNRGWGIFTQGGANIRVNVTGPNGATGKLSFNPVANLNDGKWHALTFSFNRTGSVDTFEDGLLLRSDAIATQGNIDTDDLGFAINLGQDGTGHYTDGGSAELDIVMDEVAIWTRTLSLPEANAIYNLGLQGKSLIVAPSTSSKLTATLGAGGLTVSWTGTGTLEVADAVTGPWTSAASQVNPQTVATSSAAKFYRIRQ